MTSGESRMKYVQGNLITALQSGKLDVIAHQANCFCKGRRGIAPQIFNAFPEAKLADDATVIGDKNKLGTCSIANTISGGRIYNIYGQYHFDNKRSDYGTIFNALVFGLLEMRKNLDETQDHNSSNPIRIGFPLIGCGLAGGDWSNVSKAIAEIFNDRKYDVYIYTLDKLEGIEYI